MNLKGKVFGRGGEKKREVSQEEKKQNRTEDKRQKMMRLFCFFSVFNLTSTETGSKDRE